MVESITRRPEFLENIATDPRLVKLVQDAGEAKSIVKGLEDDVTIKLERNQILEISFEEENPRIAKTIVAILVDLFVETLQGSKRSDTQSAQIFIEEKSSGAQIIQELQNAGNKRIVGIKPNIDKIARAAVPSEIIAQGRWFLPREAPWLDEYVDELLEFPNGAYMDQVDVTTQFLNTTVKPRITSTGFSI